MPQSILQCISHSAHFLTWQTIAASCSAPVDIYRAQASPVRYILSFAIALRLFLQA